MGYKFFDKRFLITPDDNGILGREVFYADSFRDLIKAVESGDSDRVSILCMINSDSLFPFDVGRGSQWRLAYYDPNYETKVAYSQGKTIQFKDGVNDDWMDTETPLWSETLKYRVKAQTFYVHEADTDCYYYNADNSISILYEGTAEECDAWIAEHTPKTRHMTNKELAAWLADNKGLVYISGFVHTTYSYLDGSDDETVPDTIRIRMWSETEWHEPLVEVKE